MVLRTIGRLILIPIAFLIAAALSIFVLVTLGLEHITRVLHSREGVEVAESVFDLAWQGTLLATGVSLIPAVLVVIVGEVARIRSWLYYMMGGGVALAAVPFLARLDMAEAGMATSTIWQVFATAGFVGGLTYWLLAGRSA